MKKVWILLCFAVASLFAEEAPPKKMGGVAPFFFADLIYWKVWQGGMAFANTGFLPPVERLGKTFEPDFQGEVGFRVGVGVSLAHDEWDLSLQYTWIHSHVGDRVTRDPALEPLQMLWPFGGNFSPIHEAHADWDFRMHVLDLEWGRPVCISRFLMLLPFFGLKGFWSDQEYRIKYFAPEGVDHLHLDQDNWGIGIRIGLKTSWYFAEHWSFYGDLALASAWTHFDEKRKDQVNDEAMIHAKFDHYGMTPILELGTGLRWEMGFHEGDYHVAVQVGWEEQVWGDYNRLLQVNETDSLGNLDFQGLTARLRFDF